MIHFRAENWCNCFTRFR